MDEREGRTSEELFSSVRYRMVREVIEAENSLPGNSENSTRTSGIVIDEEFGTEINSASFKSFLDVFYAMKPSDMYEEKGEILFDFMVQLKIDNREKAMHISCVSSSL